MNNGWGDPLVRVESDPVLFLENITPPITTAYSWSLQCRFYSVLGLLFIRVGLKAKMGNSRSE